MERTRQSGILGRMCLACGSLLAVTPVWADRLPGGTGSSGSNSGPGAGGTQPDPGETQEGPVDLGPMMAPQPGPIVYGQNLDGPLSERLQALAFGIGAFDTATGLVTVQRTADSWFQIDRNTGAFTLVSPGCPDGTGTVTTTWNDDELTVTLVGTLCNLEGNPIPVNADVTLTVGPHPGEVAVWLDGVGSAGLARNVGMLLIATEGYGSYARLASEPIHPLGEWDDLLGMAAVMVATLDGDAIHHPSYQPEDPPLRPGAGVHSQELENPSAEAAPSGLCWDGTPRDDQCVHECNLFWDAMIESAYHQYVEARQSYQVVLSDQWAFYNQAVAAAEQRRDSCLESVRTQMEIAEAVAIIVGVGAVVGTGGAAVVVVGLVGEGAAGYGIGAVFGDAANGCYDAFDRAVENAAYLRDWGIRIAYDAFIAAEEYYSWTRLQKRNRLVFCCPQKPQE